MTEAMGLLLALDALVLVIVGTHLFDQVQDPIEKIGSGLLIVLGLLSILMALPSAPKKKPPRKAEEGDFSPELAEILQRDPDVGRRLP